MKKALSLSLSVIMIFTALLGFNFAVFAEADAVTSATTNYTAPSTTATKVNVVIPAGAGVYVVKSGDVMWEIAKAHNLTLDQLLKLNPWIKNANIITVGQQILVKAGTESAVTAPVVAPVVAMTEQYLGQGTKTNFRARGTNYYFCITTASVVFDKSGKIVDAFVDVYEIGQSAFTWPTEDATVTVDAATAQFAGLLSKRDKGATYGMAKSATTGNEWDVQMNNYQNFFKGKTVAELRAWFTKSTGATGKPIVATTTTNEAELAKLALLTDAEKAQLADVVSSATMSLSDSHSLIIEAVEEAYTNKVMISK